MDGATDGSGDGTGYLARQLSVRFTVLLHLLQLRAGRLLLRSAVVEKRIAVRVDVRGPTGGERGLYSSAGGDEGPFQIRSRFMGS